MCSTGRHHSTVTRRLKPPHPTLPYRAFPLFICSISSSLTPRQDLTLFRGSCAQRSQVKVQAEYTLAWKAPAGLD